MSTDLVPSTIPEVLFGNPSFVFEAAGVSVSPDAELPSYETWESLVRGAVWVGEAWQWWLGDLLNIGESLFGEEFAQVADPPESKYDLVHRVTGLDPGHLRNIASLSGRVPRDNRRTPPLAWSTHMPVAPLDPADQVEWLQRAIDNNWTREALRVAIRDAVRPEADVEIEGDQVVEETDETTLSRADQIEAAAHRVYHQAQPTSDGAYLVPPEPFAQLRAALGEE